MRVFYNKASFRHKVYREQSLTPSAKVLLLWMGDCPKTWKFCAKGTMKILNLGEFVYQSAIQLLQEEGWIKVSRVKKQWGGWEYKFLVTILNDEGSSDESMASPGNQVLPKKSESMASPGNQVLPKKSESTTPPGNQVLPKKSEHNKTYFPGVHNNNHTRTTYSLDCKLNNIPEGQGLQVREKWLKLIQLFIDATGIKRSAPPSPSSWLRQLTRFTKTENLPKIRVRKVLQWYIRQFDPVANPYYRKYLPLYVPQANSMSGFILKFYEIEIAMLRQSASEEKTVKVTLTKRQQKLKQMMEVELERLENTRKGMVNLDTLDKLVVQIGSHLASVELKYPSIQKSQIQRTLYHTYLFSNMYPSYASWIADEVVQWSQWDGDLAKFHPGTKHWKRWIDLTLHQSNLHPPKAERELFHGTDSN